VRSPAAAIAWEFRQRHRWGLIGVASYLVVIATIKLLVLGGQPVNLESAESFAFAVVVPMTATFMYSLAVFSFGLAGDLAGRQSMYPARMFTLPVTTAALVGWPMLYGSAAMVILWMATRLLAVWPAGVHVPSVWPGVLAAALLAWTQALTWMPYGLAGVRVIAAMLWLATIDAIVLLAIHYNTSETAMVAGLAPLVPLAYLAARFAVARARRGDVPDWRGGFARPGHRTDFWVSRRGRFSSAARAQAWFEWRRHGRSLPAAVGILLPFELALLWVADNTPVLVFEIMLAVLLTPPFMAAFAAATVRKSNPGAGDSNGVTPFIATRPLTNAALIAATLRATIRSTGAAWLLVLVAVPLALTLSDTWPMVSERARQVSDAVGAPRVIALAVLVGAGLMASTWKLLVQSLYIGLTGRAWLIKGSVFLTLSALFLLGPIAQWLIDNDRLGELWSALPLLLAILVCVKTIAAVWVAARLYRGRLVSDRMLVTGAACWCVAVLGLYGALVWLLDSPDMPRYVLALLAILAIPLARLSAAPLALAWNRHR